MLVFTTSIQNTSLLYNWASEQLLETGDLYNGERLAKNRMIEMYHGHIDEHSDKRILTEFASKSSNIRVLFSTIKLGMGIDIRDIDMVILFGVPKDSIVHLWQQVGRCARDGRQGVAYIYATGISLKGCEDKHLNYLCSKESVDVCTRVKILQAFCLKENDLTQPKHMLCDSKCDLACMCSACRCCSVCKEKCKCPGKVTDISELIYNQ